MGYEKNKLGRDIKYYMVKVKYSAIYTDNFGCEQAELYFLKGGLQFNIRDCIFYDDHFDFDFYTKRPNEHKQLFYLKDDELIEYVMDVRIPLIMTYDGEECVRESILCIKRQRNSYNNMLSLNLDGKSYTVEGYNLQELLYKMKKKLPKEYAMESDFSCMLGVYSIETNKENDFYCFRNFEEDDDESVSSESFCLESSDFRSRDAFDGLKKYPITYIFNEYCLSKI
ncbi:hypothetical protein HGI38_17870 [Clostridium beijerinckii]|nr:hypothetical protein CLBIJ_25080 [Clostridium beijerinckii]MBC2418526.1 hypothetical protein [Clostridium beijerinckii]MBC2423977.1 hypothetical protein [Clostridium beijerinckii]MBC2433485.1 hypothetical protein [Clostridium beijerinckii]MBC2490719.1 hypothetical protein [Clostridium beijerinckii]